MQVSPTHNVAVRTAVQPSGPPNIKTAVQPVMFGTQQHAKVRSQQFMECCSGITGFFRNLIPNMTAWLQSGWHKILDILGVGNAANRKKQREIQDLLRNSPHAEHVDVLAPELEKVYTPTTQTLLTRLVRDKRFKRYDVSDITKALNAVNAPALEFLLDPQKSDLGGMNIAFLMQKVNKHNLPLLAAYRTAAAKPLCDADSFNIAILLEEVQDAQTQKTATAFLTAFDAIRPPHEWKHLILQIPPDKTEYLAPVLGAVGNTLPYLLGLPALLTAMTPANKEGVVKAIQLMAAQKDPELHRKMFDIAKTATSQNIDSLPKLLEARDGKIEPFYIVRILPQIHEGNQDLLPILLTGQNFIGTEHQQFAFRDYQIPFVLKKVGSDPQKLSLLRQMVVRRPKYGNNAMDFTGSNIRDIFKKLTDNNRNSLEALLQAQEDSLLGGSRNRFSGWEISNIFCKVGPDAETFQKGLGILLAARNEGLFSSDIAPILEQTNARTLPVLRALLEAKHEDNARFNPQKIAHLMLILKDHPDPVGLVNNPTALDQLVQDYDALADMKTKAEVPLFQYNDVVNVYGIKRMLMLKQTDTAKYQEMMERVKLAQEGIIPAYIFQRMKTFGELNPWVVSDIEKVKRGESVVPQFPAMASHTHILKQTQLADAVAIGDTMFVHEGDKLTPLKMDKATYLKLFPPVSRFAVSQGAIGNCYFIAGGVNDFVLNPYGRIHLYKCFEQVGNDVTVRIPGYENDPATFKDGKITLSKEGNHSNGALGYQMLEQTYALARYRSEKLQDGQTVDLATDIDAVMENITGGQSTEKGHKGGCNTDVYNDMLHAKIAENVQILSLDESLGEKPEDKDETPSSDSDKSLTMPELETVLAKYANNPHYLLGAGSKIFGETPESPLDPERSIYSQHAYSVAQINPAKRTVTLVNPWNTAEWNEIGYDQFHQNYSNLYVAKIH